MTSSSINVLIVNALVGMTRSDSSWPNPLYKLGYEVKWLEHPIKTAADKQIRPDLIITSSSLKHSLIIEGKSGGANSKQIENYSTLTTEDVKTKGFASATESHDVTIVGVGSNASTITKTVQDSGEKFPVVILQDDCIEKVLHEFCNEQVEDAFKAKIPAKLSEAPKGYIKFDEHSNAGEIAPHLIVALVSSARREETHLSTVDLTARAFGPLWSIYNNPAAKTNMAKKVQQILEDAANNELRGILVKEQLGDSPRDTSRTHWQLEVDHNHENANLRLAGLMTKANAFLSRIRGDDGQLTLFDMLDVS